MTPDFRSIDPSISWADRLAVRSAARALHQLGQRAIYEFLIETLQDMAPANRRIILARLACYERLDGEILAQLGGDDLAPLPPPREVR